MNTPMKKEQGAILIMGAFILVILIGIAAFALDLGRIYVLRAEMQNAVDSAAISAASELNGEAGARDRAMVAANQEILSHLAHFSKQSELLQGLQAEDFTFYTWIGSNSDSEDPPTDCNAAADGKCLASGDDDASYVEVKLKPSGENDSRYTVDLYFLPVLQLFSSEPVATTASSQVKAVAGTHLKVCHFPPLFICDPAEGGDDLEPGEMVALHEQGPGTTWGPGTFGWLVPDELSGLNGNQLLSHRLGSIGGQDCTDEIEVLGGQIAQWPRWGLNTRFGIYARAEHRNNPDFPSAPNVVDYPQDDNLTIQNSGQCEPSAERFGNGHWNVTECHPNPTQADQQPSTFSRNDYNSNYHASAVPNMSSRFEYYNWEISASGSLPNNSLSAGDIHGDEQQCTGNANSSCRLLNGNPNSLSPIPSYIDSIDEYKRRELFVGLVACQANNVKANSVLNVKQTGVKWARFFLTEHVSPPSGPSGVTIHAEFIEEVPDEDGHFKKVIQLYE